MADEALDLALARRLPTASASDRAALAAVYKSGVAAHAIERTTGTGPVPTNLSSERGELLAHVCRARGQLLTEDEVAALLRIQLTAARALRKSMLAVYDDLPLLGLKAAFVGAKRDGRGDAGAIRNGYRCQIRIGREARHRPGRTRAPGIRLGAHQRDR